MKSKLEVLATLWSMIFVFGLKAQDNRTELSRSIIFENQSTPEELIIGIEESVEYLNIDIDCTISKGTMVVEIYDSKGKKQGNMTLGSKTNAS